MKYAFPQNHKGKIKVSLQTDNEENLVLTIKDNGVGMSLNFKTLNPQSLGLELVKLMAKQLNGKWLLMELPERQSQLLFHNIQSITKLTITKKVLNKDE